MSGSTRPLGDIRITLQLEGATFRSPKEYSPVTNTNPKENDGFYRSGGGNGLKFYGDSDNEILLNAQKFGSYSTSIDKLLNDKDIKGEYERLIEEYRDKNGVDSVVIKKSTLAFWYCVITDPDERMDSASGSNSYF